MLDNLGRGLSERIGFTRNLTQQNVPAILIAWYGEDIPHHDNKALADIQIIAQNNPTVVPQPNPRTAIPWGIDTHSENRVAPKKFKEAGADFLICNSEALPANILTDESIASGYTLESSASKKRIALISETGFDFLLLELPNSGDVMVLSDVLAFQRQALPISTHIFATTNAMPQLEDVELLRLMSISALVLSKGTRYIDRLPEVRGKIAQLDAPKSDIELPSAQSQQIDLVEPEYNTT